MPRPLGLLPLILCITAARAAAADSPAPVVELDRVHVKGRAQALYRTDDAAVATRTDTPLTRVPQSVQVVPRQLMEDQAARQVTDLYRNIAGISPFNYASVTLRGFRQENMLYDGLRGDPYGGLTIPQLFNIERVEVLKGPTGAMYGGGEPGGTINYVSRMPTHRVERRARLQLGNEDFVAGSVELAGPLASSERVRYRVGGYADTQTGPRWNADQQTRMGDVALAFDVGQTGELLVQYTTVSQDLGGNRLRGVPADDSGRFLASRRWNHNESTDFLNMRANVGLARYRFSPAADWDVELAVRGFSNREQQIYHEPMGVQDRDGDGVPDWMTRELRNQSRENQGLAMAGHALWRAQWGSVAHKLMLGADRFTLDQLFEAQTANSADRKRRPGPVPGISLREPRYGLTSYADYGLDRLPWRRERTSSVREGVFLQDEITLSPRWYLLAGLRWDSFEDRNRIGGQRVSGSDTSWRVGATWTPQPATNLYASLASGFMPQAAARQRVSVGGPFAPETSRQWEVGLKQDLWHERLRLNAALYRIERSNIVQPTGRSIAGVDQLAPLGLVRSQGAELELMADLSERWVLNLAYAFNDARVMRAGPGGTRDAVGRRFANAPRNTLSAWTRYAFPAWSSALGFGAEYMGERISTQGQVLRPYVLFDASWQTRWRDWQFQLNLKNLLDTTYAVSGFTRRNGHFPGEPRRIYLQATYNF